MRKRIALSLLVGATLCLIACGAKQSWVKSGATPEDFARDAHECERDALATAGERGPGLAGGGGLAATVDTRGFQNACLRRRGWNLASEAPTEPPPPPSPAPSEAAPPKPAM
ncbi:MAG TPA: hypothetical protein VF007_01570 [Stellaceae bacterium]